MFVGKLKGVFVKVVVISVGLLVRRVLVRLMVVGLVVMICLLVGLFKLVNEFCMVIELEMLRLSGICWEFFLKNMLLLKNVCNWLLVL